MNKIIFILPFFIFQGSVTIRESAEVQNAVELARKVSSELIDSVRSALLEEIDKGGYLSAIKACSALSQKIVKSYQEKYNIYVRRVSEKYRNEANRPDTYEYKILEKLKSVKPIPEEYYEVVAENGENYLRYFRTLIVQPMCLNCHGPDEYIKPEIKEKLKKLYPSDKAIGYNVGDFRGAISVKIKLGSK